MTNTDSRQVRRTKAQLNSALLELIVEKGYDKTTVQDLIDRADVGRSTFYAHFETKDDLLLSGLDRLSEDIERHMSEDPSASDGLLPSLGLFRHVGEQHQLFRALLGTKGIDLVHNATLASMTERVRVRIDERAKSGEQSDVPPEARAAFVAGSLMGLMSWWMDNGRPHSPEEMANMFDQMVAAA